MPRTCECTCSSCSGCLGASEPSALDVATGFIIIILMIWSLATDPSYRMTGT